MNKLEEAEKNYEYWLEQYSKDLRKGREPWQFGMQFMANQIELWRKEVDSLKVRTGLC